MTIPPDIIEALDSILEIYFSGVTHRERAAFILCDNLVEMTCKTKAKQNDVNFSMRGNLVDACNAVTLPDAIKTRVSGYRNTRNNMQHATAAGTVSLTHCATAIFDAVKVIDHCWPNTSSTQFPDRIKCALRIIWLYSEGDFSLRERFETKMQNHKWRTQQKESVKTTGRQIYLGHRDFWYVAIRMQTPYVEECLNSVGIP